jgi:NAD(P)-dependent dehydrogenase (short-subunit alcohol dehydrogenase family)
VKDFYGKVAVITGAGSGIGKALAIALADRGTDLALSDVDTVAVADTAAACEKAGVKAVPYDLDVADRAAVYAHADDVRTEFGKVNLVFNNAGVALGATVEEMRWEDFDWLINIDFWGVVHGTKAFLPDVIDSGDGHIVNVSSVFGLMGIPSQSAYNAAKFAVRGFTESLRQEMRIARHPVGVTCVHPGGVKTNIVRDARGGDPLADRNRIDAGFKTLALTRPSSAARTILKRVERDRPRVLIGPDARGFDLIPRIVGPRYQDLQAPLARIAFALGERLGFTL